MLCALLESLPLEDIDGMEYEELIEIVWKYENEGRK